MLSSLLVLLFLCDRIQTTTGFHIATWLKVRNGIVSWQQSCSHRIEITTYSMSSIHAQSTQFIVSRTGPVTPEEIANENLIRIVNLHATDLQCNELCWKCLGYVYDNVSHTYSSEHVFPKWKDTFPSPPDIIGMKRSYDVIIDKPVRDASMALMRSIPRDFKGGVRALEKEGFTGYKLSELTPNKTRRAQVHCDSAVTEINCGLCCFHVNLQ